MLGLRTVIKRIYHDQPDKAVTARTQYMAYKNRRGVFSDSDIFDDAQSMPAHEWWEFYGAELEELQHVAMKVLSKRSAACSVERLWSLFGLVWSDSRANLGPEKAIDLVKAGSNLRLKKKLLAMDYEAEMRSWTADAADSDDDDEEEEEEAEEEEKEMEEEEQVEE